MADTSIENTAPRRNQGEIHDRDCVTPLPSKLDFEQRLERHRVNGATGLHYKNEPLGMAYELTGEVSGLLLTIGAGFDGHSPEIQTLNGEIVQRALDGVARLAKLANFYIDEARDQMERQRA